MYLETESFDRLSLYLTNLITYSVFFPLSLDYGIWEEGKIRNIVVVLRHNLHIKRSFLCSFQSKTLLERTQSKYLHSVSPNSGIRTLFLNCELWIFSNPSVHLERYRVQERKFYHR